MDVEATRKLDYRLGNFLENGNVAASEEIPIIIRVGDSSHIDGVVSIIEAAHGTIRHRLAMINAVSAWVNRQLLETLSKETEVVGLEFVDWTEIAENQA